MAEASLMADVDLKEIYVSVSSRHMHSFNSHGMARIPDDTVKSDDIHAAVDDRLSSCHQSSKSCICPQDYV